MSDLDSSWFHCGRCGFVFHAPVGDTKDRRCPECGSNPSLGYDPQPTDTKPVEVAVLAPENFLPGKVPRRRRKPMNFMVKLLSGWTLLVVLIVVVTKLFWQDLPKNEKFVSKQDEERRNVSPEDLALLDAAIPLCSQTFSGFLSARSPEERNQFVLSPITTAARMARYYDLNSSINFDAKTLTMTRNAVLRLPAGPAIETQWKSVAGGLFDVVFIKENGEWRLDWDHYVRYSDYPWALYLVGGGEDEGEFRLLARERLANERRDLETISLVLCAPRLGYAKDIGTQSPEILVPRDSKNGKLLSAAFKCEKEKGRAFGVKLTSLNPEDLIRVRVKVLRSKTELGYKFEIQDLMAGHWYSEEDPGIELPAAPLKK